MSVTFLKVKIKALAAEARVIKMEEARFPRGRRNHEVCVGLHHHRVEVVRRAARSAHLAYGYIRGRAYKRLEEKCYEDPNAAEIAKLVTRYGNETTSWAVIDLWLRGTDDRASPAMINERNRAAYHQEPVHSGLAPLVAEDPPAPVEPPAPLGLQELTRATQEVRRMVRAAHGLPTE